MNRRGFLAGLMAGGVIVAGELWIPGQKLISIPSGKQFYGPSIFELIGQDIKYVGPEDKTVSMRQFYNWLKSIGLDKQPLMDMQTSNEGTVSLAHGYRIDKPEYLTDGSLQQDRVEQLDGVISFDREHWSAVGGLGDTDLIVDKIYQPDYYSTPRERTREDEDGLKGWR
jgi:hypothetical protein